MEKNLPFVKGLFSFLFLLLGPIIVSATTIPVTSITDLQTAINNAAPGDVIILANGVYTATTDITINKKGLQRNQSPLQHSQSGAPRSPAQVVLAW